MLKMDGYEFVEETKYPNINESAQGQGKPQPPYEIPLEPGRPVIDLPKPADIDLGTYDLRKAIEERRSLRRYSDDSLTLEEFHRFGALRARFDAAMDDDLNTGQALGFLFETVRLLNRMQIGRAHV